jgi:hypothetical protein
MYYRGQTFVRFLFLAEAGFYSLISPIEQKATPAMAKIENPYLRRWLSTVDLIILTSLEQILWILWTLLTFRRCLLFKGKLPSADEITGFPLISPPLSGKLGLGSFIGVIGEATTWSDAIDADGRFLAADGTFLTSDDDVGENWDSGDC